MSGDVEDWSNEELYGKIFGIMDSLSWRYNPGRKPRISRMFAGRMDTNPTLSMQLALPHISLIFHRFNAWDKGNYMRMKRLMKEAESRKPVEYPLEPSNFYLHYYHEKHRISVQKKTPNAT